MNTIDPGFLERAQAAFADNIPPSLDEVRARVDIELTGTRRRDLLSGLATLSRVMNIELSQIRATPEAVQTLLASHNAIELGLTELRWRNVRSGVVTAVKMFGAIPANITKNVPINAIWAELLRRAIAKHHRNGLARLARFCSVMNILPQEVGKDILLGFHEALIAEELILNPRAKLKHTIAIWNMCHRRVDDWPDIHLSSPFERKVIKLPLETFPKSFRSDLDNWRKRLLDPDPMDPLAPRRALKPISVKGQEAVIVRFASALVHSKAILIEDITGLSVLVSDLDLFKAGLRFFLERFDNQPGDYVAKIAATLRAVAKHNAGVGEEVLDAMDGICDRLRPRRQEGLKAKNRERLRQFDDPANVARLLAYPEEEAKRGRNHSNPYRAAKCFERALAVSLLITTSVRINNLRTISLNTDIQYAQGKSFLSIPGERVKNGVDLDFELPGDTSDLLKEYLQVYRPRFPGSDGPYLFPGRDGGPRPHSTIANGIKGSLYKRTGLIINPHLFRHAMAKIVFERNPGLAFTISRHLGHKSINMTMGAYLGTEGRAASRSIDRVLKSAAINPKLPEV